LRGGGPASFDVSAWIAQQDSALGARPGTVVLTQAGVLSHDVRLGPGHNLRIAAPLEIGKGHLRLEGHNTVVCTAPVVVDVAEDVMLADGVSDLSVTGCEVRMKATGAGYLVSATRAARVTMRGNRLLDMGLFETQNHMPRSETTDVTIEGNSVRFDRTPLAVGVLLEGVLGATITDNEFVQAINGVQWWGGDAHGGWRGPDSARGAGNFLMRGNHCTGTRDSCIWGSMGTNIVVDGNQDDGCGDVCFDVEGGTDVVFTHNAANHCGNGCYAAEFESEGAVFRSNQASGEAGHVLVLIKHSPLNPYPHRNVWIDDNDLTCAQLCVGLYTQGDEGLRFTGNRLTNATVQAAVYHRDFAVLRNTFRFTVALGEQPAIAGPVLWRGSLSEIADNVVVAETPQPGAVCIAQSWLDWRYSDTMRILRNRCTGLATGIVTATGGAGLWGARAEWVVAGNQVQGAAAGRSYLHARIAGREHYAFAADNR